MWSFVLIFLLLPTDQQRKKNNDLHFCKLWWIERLLSKEIQIIWREFYCSEFSFIPKDRGSDKRRARQTQTDKIKFGFFQGFYFAGWKVKTEMQNFFVYYYYFLLLECFNRKRNIFVWMFLPNNLIEIKFSHVLRHVYFAKKVWI